jgi:hypothetical protein
MGTSESPIDEKDQKWIEIIEEWRESGQSIAEWIRAQDELSYEQFIFHRRRLFPEDIKKSEFIEKETTWSAISMDIPSSSFDVYINDCRVVIRTGFDEELLREVVEVLKNAH